MTEKKAPRKDIQDKLNALNAPPIKNKQDFVKLIRDVGLDPATDLEGADLSSLDLDGVDLTAANLKNADLRGTNLSGAKLDYSNLESADLRVADLENASLRGANLTAANIRDINLSGADLSDAIITDVQVSPDLFEFVKNRPVSWKIEIIKLVIAALSPDFNFGTSNHKSFEVGDADNIRKTLNRLSRAFHEANRGGWAESLRHSKQAMIDARILGANQIVTKATQLSILVQIAMALTATPEHLRLAFLNLVNKFPALQPDQREPFVAIWILIKEAKRSEDRKEDSLVFYRAMENPASLQNAELEAVRRSLLLNE